MKIHCIGIGGIGVSALARYYLSKECEVSGSDLAASEITTALAKEKVRVLIGNSADHISEDLDLVVYSPAVPKDNPELVQAKTYRIKTKSYPEALGELTKQYYTIAISGSHGKSTTTALVALILVKAGIDPTVIVGTKLKEFGDSNFRQGKSKYLVIEACEYDGSFLEYDPKIIVVTNVDKEHVDYFKTFANVKKTFKNFVKKLPKDGFLVFNADDPHSKFGFKNSREYSLKDSEAKQIKEILQIPGEHNVSNALAALQVARILDISDETSFEALGKYQGSWRRFEVVKTKPYTVISDYGHHPNEVAATLKSAREKFPGKKIWLIFQPHQYQRTHYLFDDFVEVFRRAPIDEIIITDIYDVAGREEKDISQETSSSKLVEAIISNHVTYKPVDAAEQYVKQHMKDGEVLIIMGAGDIYKLAKKF
jgi:UDP-N-acetylmuramate--alanine ligase